MIFNSYKIMANICQLVIVAGHRGSCDVPRVRDPRAPRAFQLTAARRKGEGEDQRDTRPRRQFPLHPGLRGRTSPTSEGETVYQNNNSLRQLNTRYRRQL